MDTPVHNTLGAFLAAERLARLVDEAVQYTKHGADVPLPLMQGIQRASEEWTRARLNSWAERGAR